MDSAVDNTVLSRIIGSLQPDEITRARLLGLVSAAIATDDQLLIVEAFSAARKFDLPRNEIYEIILQSYLFLGFPRMLNAAETLHHVWPAKPGSTDDRQVEPAEPTVWMERGEQLCREVYADLYEPLKRKVESFAPDVFYWMVLEGYGKVLSRANMSMADRELSIVAFLIIDNRPRQLHSHLRGAFNSGTPTEQLLAVVSDLEEAVPSGGAVARKICAKLGIV